MFFINILNFSPYNSAPTETSFNYMPFLKEMYFKYIIKVMPVIIPFIGLIYQLYHIIDAYVSYTSVSEITMIRKDRLQAPVFVFCNRWNESEQNWSTNSIPFNIT